HSHGSAAPISAHSPDTRYPDPMAAPIPPRPDRVLRQHIETDRLLGVEAVPMGEARAAPASVAPPPPAAPATERAVAPSPPASINVGDKLAVLQAMDQHEVRSCTRCDLHAGRTQTVFGEGDPDADLMIVGEGPGAEEDRTGRPFVGRAGELLTKQIAAMGLTRPQVYIANVVKCRPPNNRTPTPAEAATCGDYLRRQIETIRPKVILTVGGPAAKLLLGTNTGITRLRGTWHTYDASPGTPGTPGILPIPVMPTFHPAYLLRSYTKENRVKVWEDLQQVMRKLDE
ncbi:MAG: uracil-DNA glycosylase, partial [Planctomycetota bacterium]